MNALLIILSALSVSFSHLSYKDGLTSGSVTDIFFDEKGVVWIGTGNGLNSYDGFRTTNFPCSNNSVMRLVGDGTGKLFVASRNEVYSLDLKTYEHTTISEDNSRAIAYQGGYLYVTAGNVLKRYSADKALSETVAVLNTDDKITALAHNDNGCFWLGTEDGDVVKFELKSGVCGRWNAGSMVENLYLDSRGQVWAATFSSGLFCILPSGETQNLKHSANDSGTNSISSDFVRCICEDNNGRYWIGTFSGLDCLDYSTGEITHYFPDRIRPESLSNSSVWVIKKDNQGTMWVGTFFGGINYFQPDFSYYTKFPISPFEGTGLNSGIIRKVEMGDNGKLLVATEGGGLNIVDPVTFKSTCYRKGGEKHLSENNVKDFIFDHRRQCIWTGTHLGGLDRIDLKTGKSVSFRQKGRPGDDPLTDDILSLEDAEDSIYLGSTRGLFIFSKATAAYRAIALGRGVNDIRKDISGRIWFTNGDLQRYDPNTYTSLTVLPGKQISCICPLEDGRLALGSNAECGIVIYNPENAEYWLIDMARIWSVAERTRGIVQSPVTGRLMVSSDRGFSTMTADGEDISYFNASKGFPLDNTSEFALAETRDGIVYVGGLSGLVSFPESAISVAGRPYKTVFSKLIFDSETSRNILYDTALTIPSDISSFSVEFISSNHIAGNSSSFEYKMEGLAKKWTDIWYGNSISFTNLPHGNYTLHLRPKDTDSSICPEISIPVKILPPWYKTALAKISYLLLAILFSVLGARRLISYLRKRETEKLERLRHIDAERFRFFEKATSIVYSNLDNGEFSIAEFASQMAMSRSTLFEKFKSATGLTPNDFLMDIRLKEGMKLLKNTPELNISDISFKVGFSSAHYFSKCFKARYGESPVAFRKAYIEKNSPKARASKGV